VTLLTIWRDKDIQPDALQWKDEKLPSSALHSGHSPSVALEPSIAKMLVVIGKSVKSSRDTSGGTVVMVDVTAVGRGPTVSVEPSVVMVVTPVTTEPKGTVKTILEPSGSVKVSTVTVGMVPVAVMFPGGVIALGALVKVKFILAAWTRRGARLKRTRLQVRTPRRPWHDPVSQGARDTLAEVTDIVRVTMRPNLPNHRGNSSSLISSCLCLPESLFPRTHLVGFSEEWAHHQRSNMHTVRIRQNMGQCPYATPIGVPRPAL
jgi:hypothetical protein